MNTKAVMEGFSLQSPLYVALKDPCLQTDFYSPGGSAVAAHVESVSGWRKQARAEEDAGIASDPYAVLVRLFRCDLCQICIGRNYYEQELYLYPVYQQKERIGDDPTYYPTARYLHICGGCAHRRHLPSSLCMIEPKHYTTTLLLQGEGETVRDVDPASTGEKLRIRRAMAARIAAFERTHAPQVLWQMLRDGLAILPPGSPIPAPTRPSSTSPIRPLSSSSSLFTSPLRAAFPAATPVSSHIPTPAKDRQRHSPPTSQVAVAKHIPTHTERRRIAL